jgi:hypothetical protein
MGPMPTCEKGRVDGRGGDGMACGTWCGRGGRLATMAGVGLVGDTVIARGGGGPIRGVGEETDRWACLWEWAPTAASGNPLRGRPDREKQKEFKF